VDPGASQRKVRELAPEEAVAANPSWQAHTRAAEDVEDASLADLEWAHVAIFGTPTRHGNVAAQRSTTPTGRQQARPS
jgi:NAD(P)H dehydrogenase (quinone)